MHKSRAHLVIDSERAGFHRHVAKLGSNLDYIRAKGDEYTKNDAAAKAPDGDIPRATLEQAQGIQLHHSQLINRLRCANPTLHFEVSRVTGRIGIYDQHRTYLGMTIAQGMNPEFTPLIQRKDGTLESVQCGYRTVLSRLIRSRHITESQAVNLFGAVNSLKWKRSLA